MKIGILGTGTIATAVVRGIAGDGHSITVSKRSAANAAALAREFDNVTVAGNQTVLDQSDVVILGLMAEVAPEILGPLAFRPEQKIITLMAGASLKEADALVRPARCLAIMMPFPGIAQGGTPLMMQGDAELVGSIFGARNTLFPLDAPEDMAAYLSAQAVLSVVARTVAEAADWLGARVDDPAQGEAFLRLLVSSSLADTPCKPLIEALNTPGGYNQRLRLHMEHSGMGNALVAGLNALEGGA